MNLPIPSVIMMYPLSAAMGPKERSLRFTHDRKPVGYLLVPLDLISRSILSVLKVIV